MAEHSTVARSAVRPSEPARQVIATFDSYADAERLVDYLSDQRFEVNRVAIVGRDLEYVEQVLGRLNYGGAALRGAGSGALVGALIGWIFGLFNWIQPALYIPTMLGSPLFQLIFFTKLGQYAHAESRDFYIVGNAVQVCAMSSV